MKLIIKSKRGNDKELPHTEVYFGTELLGYFLPNKSKFAAMNENWNFVSKSNKVHCFHARTKKEIIDTLEAFCGINGFCMKDFSHIN